MPIVDQYSDPSLGYLVRQLTAMPALQDFVKEATIAPGDGDALPDTAFAWPDQRKFPLHSPEHAALSYAYAKLAADLPESVSARLATALDVYGVSLSLFDTVKQAASVDLDVFLLPAKQLFPVTDAASTKYAAYALVEQMPNLLVSDRVEACTRLVEKAAAHGVVLPIEVMKLAGFVVASTRALRTWLQARQEALPEAAAVYKAAYAHLDDALRDAPAEMTDRSELMKFASALADLDARSGLDKHYDRRLPDAQRSVFNTSKLAAETIDLDGRAVSLNSLTKLPSSFWADLGGAELADEVAPGGKPDPARIRVVIPTLPLDLRMVLARQIRE